GNVSPKATSGVSITTFASCSSSKTDAHGSGAVATSTSPSSNIVVYWAGFPVTCSIVPPVRFDVMSNFSFMYVSNCTSCVQPTCGELNECPSISSGSSIPLSSRDIITVPPVEAAANNFTSTPDI